MKRLLLTLPFLLIIIFSCSDDTREIQEFIIHNESPVEISGINRIDSDTLDALTRKFKFNIRNLSDTQIKSISAGLVMMDAGGKPVFGILERSFTELNIEPGEEIPQEIALKDPNTESIVLLVKSIRYKDPNTKKIITFDNPGFENKMHEIFPK